MKTTQHAADLEEDLDGIAKLVQAHDVGNARRRESKPG